MSEASGVPLLDIQHLSVDFVTRKGTVRAIDDISVAINKGETLGIVGESGSGKSVTSYAVMRILDRAGRIAGGSIIARFSRSPHCAAAHPSTCSANA